MKEDKKSGMESRVILETDKINLSSGEHYLIREDKLISIPKGKWKEINEGDPSPWYFDYKIYEEANG